MLHDLCCLKIGKEIAINNSSIDVIRYVCHVENDSGEVAGMTKEVLAGPGGESLRYVCITSLLSFGTNHIRCT